MANRVAKILGGVVVLAAVGAGAAWYVVSGQIVENTKTLLTKLESEPTATFKVKAESIARAPFPAIGVRVVNPTLEVTMPAGQDGQSTVVSSKVQSTTDIVTDYIGHQYRIVSKISGDSTNIFGGETFTYVTSPTTLAATLKSKDMGSFNKWNALNFDDKAAVLEALKNIAAGSMTMSAFTMTDKVSGKMLMTQEAFDMAAVNRSRDALVDFDFMIDLKGSEISPEYHQLINKIMASSDSKSPMAGMDMPFSSSRAGKQDMKIDMTVKAPLGASGMKTGLVDIRNMSLKNNFYTISLPTKLQMTEGDNPIGIVNLNWSIDATPAGAAEMQRAIDMGLGFAGGMFQRVDAQGQPMALPAELKEKITTALPAMSALGPVIFKVDSEVAMQNMGQVPQSITIKDFNFSHKRWGLAAQGNVGMDKQSGPKVDITINCTQCETMTRDMVAAAYQAEQVNILMDKAAQPWGISQNTLTSVNSLLGQIGKKDESGNLVIAISTPTAGDIRINDKPFGEVMMMAMSVMAPQTAPAAGTVEATTAAPAPAVTH